MGDLHAADARIDRAIPQHSCQCRAKHRVASKPAAGCRCGVHDGGGFPSDGVARAVDQEGGQEEGATKGIDIEAAGASGLPLNIRCKRSRSDAERLPAMASSAISDRAVMFTTFIGGTPSAVENVAVRSLRCMGRQSMENFHQLALNTLSRMTVKEIMEIFLGSPQLAGAHPLLAYPYSLKIFLRQTTRGERAEIRDRMLCFRHAKIAYRRAELLLLCGSSHNCKLAKTRAFAFQRILDAAHTARSTYPRFCKPKVGSSILSTGTSKKSAAAWALLEFPTLRFF